MAKTKTNKKPFPKGIYGITDPDLLTGDALYSGVEGALKGGCAVIQYRNKKASQAQQLIEARELTKLCSSYQACFIINDNLQLALESNADGVHLGKSDGDISAARKALGPNRYLGVTCHSDLEYAKNAIEKGVDYCAFGRFFPSKTKPNAPHSPLSIIPELLKLPVPILAIGGITVDNMSQLLDTPSDKVNFNNVFNNVLNNVFNNVAVVHGLFGQPDIEKAAAELSKTFFSLT